MTKPDLGTVSTYFSSISRLLRARFDLHLRARNLPLTRAQWRILNQVRRHEGLNQSRLSEVLELEYITVSRLVDGLESGGLIERRRDPRDRRAQLLYLTPEAAPILVELEEIARETTTETFANLTAEQLEQLVQTLGILRENLEALGPVEQDNVATAMVAGRKAV